MFLQNNEIVRENEKLANNNYFTNKTTNLYVNSTKINPKANLESIPFRIKKVFGGLG